MGLIKGIFYFFGVFAIMYELWNIRYFNKMRSFLSKFNQTKGVKYDQATETQKGVIVTGCTFRSLQMLYFFWAFTGLFTTQWFFFILLIGLGIFSSRFFKDNMT